MSVAVINSSQENGIYLNERPFANTMLGLQSAENLAVKAACSYHMPLWDLTGIRLDSKSIGTWNLVKVIHV